jgi:hypothetical protein
LKPISLSKAKFVNFTRALQKEAWVAYRNYGKQIVASCVEMATGNGIPFKTLVIELMILNTDMIMFFEKLLMILFIKVLEERGRRKS